MTPKALLILFVTFGWQLASVPAAPKACAARASAAKKACCCGDGEDCHCCCKNKSSDGSSSESTGLTVCQCNAKSVPTVLPRQSHEPRPRELVGFLALPTDDAAVTASATSEVWAIAHSPPNELSRLTTLILLI